MNIYSSLSSRKCAFGYIFKVARTNVPSLADGGPRDRFYPCFNKSQINFLVSEDVSEKRSVIKVRAILNKNALEKIGRGESITSM